MLTEVQSRAIEEAEYIVSNHTTVRETAKYLGLSKSTVHKDLMTALREIRPALYDDVRVLLDFNKAERHLRGGMATKRKYAAQTGRKKEGTD